MRYPDAPVGGCPSYNFRESFYESCRALAKGKSFAKVAGLAAQAARLAARAQRAQSAARARAQNTQFRGLGSVAERMHTMQREPFSMREATRAKKIVAEKL